MKIGDKIKMKTYGIIQSDPVWYTVVEIGEEWIKVKHPQIGGHFTFKKDRIDDHVAEVIDESR